MRTAVMNLSCASLSRFVVYLRVHEKETAQFVRLIAEKTLLVGLGSRFSEEPNSLPTKLLSTTIKFIGLRKSLRITLLMTVGRLSCFLTRLQSVAAFV